MADNCPIANFVPDRWIALLSLQKSIRRGAIEPAAVAAAVLWSEATELCNQLHRAPENLCNRLHEEGSGSCIQLHDFNARIAYLDAARAPATHRAYAADIAAFVAWGGTIPTTKRTVPSPPRPRARL